MKILAYDFCFFKSKYSLLLIPLLFIIGLHVSFPLFSQNLDSANTFFINEFKDYRDGFHKDKLWILEDAKGELTIKEIIKIANPQLFPSDSLNVHYQHFKFKPIESWYDAAKKEYLFDHQKVYWGKITLVNQTDRHTDWMYYVGFNNVIELYEDKGKGLIIKKMGGQYVPSSQKDVIQGRVSPFQISLSPKEPVTFYIRALNFNKRPADFYLALVKPSYWNQMLQRRNLIEGLFNGVLLVMFFYNLLLFVSNQDRTYLYYAIYILNVVAYFFVIKGFSREYLLGEYPIAEPYIWAGALGLSPVFYFQFVRHYIHTWILVPRWDKWLKIASLISFLVVLLEILILYLNFDVWLVGQISAVLLIAVSLFSLILIVKLLITKDKLAYYLVAGSICLWTGSSIGLIYTAAYYFGDGLFWGQAGIVAEVLIFSLGLGYRLKKAQTEKQEAQQKLIHQLKENEQIQIEANRQLEDKVRQRTKEIEQINAALKLQKEEIETQKENIAKQNEDFILANQRLLQLNEEKNHLIGVVAHDLRNPLTSALSMANLLQSDAENLDEDQKECLSLLTNSLTRMNSMIERILDVNAIEGKKLNINLIELDVACLVERVVKSFYQKAETKKIHLEYEVTHCRLLLDETYFMQVMENLISNAIKFSPQEKKITVALWRNDKYYRISVKDEGPGLSEDDKKKLFGKYQKLSAQPTAGEKSTGLGLSIAKKYVEAMGGKIWCESELGKGATFLLEFPCPYVKS
ncbi:MAG: 7TM diverse intracellular signaling domain-containing protein [Flammeovirgaceae bacterium]